MDNMWIGAVLFVILLGIGFAVVASIAAGEKVETIPAEAITEQPETIPAETIIQRPRRSGVGMKAVGGILFALGLLALFGADQLNDKHVVNLQLLTIGETFTIAGAVFLTARLK